MKYPDNLKPEDKKWDTYKEFHWPIEPQWWGGTAPFYAFETGEIIATSCATDYQWRKRYPTMNVELIASRDPGMPPLKMIDGTPVPKAWLNEGCQTHMMIDYDSGRVVCLDPEYDYASRKVAPHAGTIPARFAGSGPGPTAVAYFPGGDRPPIGHVFRLSVPYRTYSTKDELEYLRTTQEALRIGLKLAEHQVLDAHYWQRPHALDPQLLYRVGTDVSKLGWHEASAVYWGTLTRKKLYAPYLLLA